MPIVEVRAPRRQLVAWFGAAPTRAGIAAFVSRELAVECCTERQIADPDYLAGAAAVVFTQDDTKLSQVVGHLRKHGLRLLDYDCRVIVRPTPAGVKMLANALENLGLPTAGVPRTEPGDGGDGVPWLPHVRIFEQRVPWRDIANYVVAHPPGDAPNRALNIIVEGGRPLRPGAELLIRRAFANCIEVHLWPMDDGHSGVSVFRAYAERSGLLGRWPLPYFVKVGERDKVLVEYKNYEGQVDPYIPFHLGPHLARERCGLGAKEGIIVGDFVDESESLAACASDGRAAAAIACLFDRTLRGWHRDVELDERHLRDLLWVPPRIPDARMARARELGARREIAALHAIVQRLESSPVWSGPIHGDLHAANVRVRATDAIVIDFYASKRGPLVYDAACLEASLLVAGFTNDARDPATWLRSIEPLYEEACLLGVPPHANPRDPSAWFHACVRQIRMYAKQVEYLAGQYPIALACALLVKASKNREVAEPEASRRAVAYVLAERLLARIPPAAVADHAEAGHA